MFKCDICHSNFTQKCNLRKHIASVHWEKNIQKMWHLLVNFYTNRSLKKSYWIISQRKKTQMWHLSIKFYRKRQFKNAYKISSWRKNIQVWLVLFENTYWICSWRKNIQMWHLPSIFTEKGSLKKHIKSVHEGKTFKHELSIKFVVKIAWKKHIESVHKK